MLITIHPNGECSFKLAPADKEIMKFNKINSAKEYKRQWFDWHPQWKEKWIPQQKVKRSQYNRTYRLKKSKKKD
jgi:hypothetical protein